MAKSVKVPLRSVSLIFACGTALFSDGYANHVIGGVDTLLIRIYGEEALTEKNINRMLTSLSYAGTIIGMLTFGFLSDKVGRKFGMLASSGTVAVFSALAAMSSGASGNVNGLLRMLCASRFFLGIGIGAEYPCGSVAASEQSEEEGIGKNAQSRWLILATNSTIDAGSVIASFVPLVIIWILGDNHPNATWRVSLALGVVPALGVFLWRYSMEESPRYKTDSMKYASIPYILILRRYGVRLAAISSVWFLYDFIAYPFGIYASAILNNLTGGSDSLHVIFGWNVVISMFLLPGAFGGAFLVDYIGAKNTLIIGLVSQAIIGFIMSALYKQLTSHMAAFTVIYGVFLSLGEVGPGNCTFVLASKNFPTAVRGQFFGVAAAAGKVGAFVGTWVFPSVIQAFGGSGTARGNTGPFWVASGVAILSAIVAFFFVAPVSRDGMVEEDRQLREYLTLHGYDTSVMGLGPTPGCMGFVESMSLECTDRCAGRHSAASLAPV
ncbi:MFS Git1p-related glycerophosphoinositol and glycerophosphocholine permease [Infundibulicybe gibba]|nr:MFS Git1p-related glycerophosphoinositol and glycerophosphocholine permease [Infundibulicybe gibba]